MRRVLFGLLLAPIVALVAVNIPDLRRYLRIKAM
jgi:hypothetical protein